MYLSVLVTSMLAVRLIFGEKIIGNALVYWHIKVKTEIWSAEFIYIQVLKYVKKCHSVKN